MIHALGEFDPIGLLLLRLLLHLKLVGDFYSGAPPAHRASARRTGPCKSASKGAPIGVLHLLLLLLELFIGDAWEGNGESEVRSLTSITVRTFPARLTPIEFKIKIELDGLGHVVDLRNV